MEDMDEYLNCLDVIGETNHIHAEDDDSAETKATTNAEQTDQGGVHEAVAEEMSARGPESAIEESKHLSPRDEADNGILPEVDHRRKESA